MVRSPRDLDVCEELLGAYAEPTRTYKTELFAKNSKELSAVKYFCKKLHLRSSI